MTRQPGGGSSERTPGGGNESAEGGPLLLGHRGARVGSRLKLGRRGAKIPPENTLLAFEYALTQGCDGFEFDVRATRDERLVLCHDASLLGLKVAASSYDSLCSRCGETLPCLEDVLRSFGDRAYLDIEIKAQGGEELVIAALGRSKPQHYLLSSFLPEVLHRFHELDATLPLGYICDRPADVPIWRELPVQAFLPQYKLVGEELAREVHGCGRQIFAWTVNRQQDLQRLAAWGIDGLISDDPGLLGRTFASREL